MVAALEEELDDDAESIITNERYEYIASIIKSCYKKRKARGMTTSDKIDRVVTNRWAALPIFAVVMFIVYYISVTTVGTIFTDWANDGVFGDGWHLAGVGSEAYTEASDAYSLESSKVDAYIEAAGEAGVETEAISAMREAGRLTLRSLTILPPPPLPPMWRAVWIFTTTIPERLRKP